MGDLLELLYFTKSGLTNNIRRGLVLFLAVLPINSCPIQIIFFTSVGPVQCTQLYYRDLKNIVCYCCQSLQGLAQSDDIKWMLLYHIRLDCKSTSKRRKHQEFVFCEFIFHRPVYKKKGFHFKAEDFDKNAFTMEDIFSNETLEAVKVLILSTFYESVFCQYPFAKKSQSLTFQLLTFGSKISYEKRTKKTLIKLT